MSAVKRKKRNRAIPQVIKVHHLESQFLKGDIVLEVGVNRDNPKQKETKIRRQCAYDRLLS